MIILQSHFMICELLSFALHLMLDLVSVLVRLIRKINLSLDSFIVNFYHFKTRKTNKHVLFFFTSFSFLLCYEIVIKHYLINQEMAWEQKINMLLSSNPCWSSYIFLSLSIPTFKQSMNFCFNLREKWLINWWVYMYNARTSASISSKIIHNWMTILV